jgi:hypothetical protein
MPKPFTAREGVCCTMPTTLSAAEAAIYQKLRKMHCANGKPGHECSGKVSLDRNGLTLNCPLCGDHRSLYPAPADG